MQTRAHLNDGKMYGSMNMIHGQDKVKQNKTVEKRNEWKEWKKIHTHQIHDKWTTCDKWREIKK